MTGTCIMGKMREDREPKDNKSDNKSVLNWNKKFIYPKSQRSMILGKRHYDISSTQTKLPSVTTILSATQSEEKRQALANWKARVGDKQADFIRDSAATRGTAMHAYLEDYVLGKQRVDLTDVGKLAGTMARKIIESGLGDLGEVWGSEVTLYYPDRYAGATDLVGLYGDQESICDYKQSNKPKRREWIGEMFLQLAAYASAHNKVYDTKITQGVILMCTPDNFFQRFIVDGQEFLDCQEAFHKKVDQYYRDQKDQPQEKETENK